MAASPIAIVLRDTGEVIWKCDTTTCLYVARHETFWPGSTGKKCNACATRMRGIAIATGFELVTKPIEVPNLDPDDTAVRFSLIELT